MSNQSSPSRGTVMVIEDDPDCLEAMADALQFDGYEVIVSTNGLEALGHLKAHRPPDLILLDLMMPVMDGWEFLRAQRELAPLAHVPVALLSGERELDRLAAELAVEGHIQKPIALDKLLETVQRLISKPQK